MNNRTIWVTSLVFGVASGGELYYWIHHESPLAPHRLQIFFLLLFLMISSFGTALAYYLAIRFNGESRTFVVVRQGAEIGLFVAVCAWLQLVHLLSPVVAVIVVGAVISFEVIWTGKNAPPVSSNPEVSPPRTQPKEPVSSQ